MSDNLKRYRAIKDALQQFYPREAKGHLAQHLNCLAALVCGIVGSKQSQLPLIASKIPGASQPASRAKTCSRWINDERNDYDTYFLPFVQELLLQLSQVTLVLIMDSSEVGRKCMTLMVSAVHRGRALPLAWVVYHGNKGHLPEGTHIGLLESVLEILPPNSDVVVLGDGEFDGTGLLETIEQLGARYVCRTAQNALLTGEDEVLSFADVGLKRGQQIALPGIRFTHRRYGPLLAIAWWHKDYCEPLYLVSNFCLMEEACYYYAKRFHIETFFSDQKSRGFNLHKSHLSDPMRLARLMLATCLAYLWIVYLGIIAIADGWQRFIHRHDRCDLSLFQLGLRLLDHFLETSADIPVAFQIA